MVSAAAHLPQTSSLHGGVELSTAHSKRGEREAASAAMAGSYIIYTPEPTQCSGERYKPHVNSEKGILSGDWSLSKILIAVISGPVVFLLKQKILLEQCIVAHSLGSKHLL